MKKRFSVVTVIKRSVNNVTAISAKLSYYLLLKVGFGINLGLINIFFPELSNHF